MTPLFGSGKLIDSEAQDVESVAPVYSLLARLWMQEVAALNKIAAFSFHLSGALLGSVRLLPFEKLG